MMEQKMNLIPLLEYINPVDQDYHDWIAVGMALKLEGYDLSVWDNWSSRDSLRYHQGECARKWETFNTSPQNSLVTGGTIVQMAKDGGWIPQTESKELEWDDEIGYKDDFLVVDSQWIEDREIHIPSQWEPVKQLITYLETLFEASENVGYVTQSWEKDGKYLPTKGCWDRTAGELIEALSKCKGDLGAALGDYNPEAGAWIRFNPLDGNGCKNENVTDYRYALVESDDMELSWQNAIIHELEIPVACLIFSGKKSLHAIVRIDAKDYGEYRQRVDYLYQICQKNGLKIDIQNKNPSRLSRMPGVMRRGQKQYLLETNIGRESWESWKNWIEDLNDDLPDLETMADVWDNLPNLSPPLIDGVLRKGHKMLMAGPSKAGKSFALIELCIAIAEGQKWLKWNCSQGRVLYVNLELDRASCLHRFKDVYEALDLTPKNLKNIDIWNLRGNSVPMDKLAPKLIRRATKKEYTAVVIDPIYKIITGDENSADQMAHFCNQFDKVCNELECAVIYCHHHSKGTQGGKRSMDRASGSGVFARDPDALIDLIELPLTDALCKQEENKAIATICAQYITQHGMEDAVSQDDLCSGRAMLEACERLLPGNMAQIKLEIQQAKKAVQSRTAWRLSGTLREFPSFPDVNVWFDYPVHHLDDSGVLMDVHPEIESPPWKHNFDRKKSAGERKKERSQSLEMAYEACKIDGNVTLSTMAEYLGITEKTVRNRLKSTRASGLTTETSV